APTRRGNRAPDPYRNPAFGRTLVAEQPFGRSIMATLKKNIRRAVRNLKQKAVDKGEDAMASMINSVKKKAKPLVKDAKKKAIKLEKQAEKAAGKAMKDLKKAAKPKIRDAKKSIAKTAAKAVVEGGKIAAKGAVVAAKAGKAISEKADDARGALKKGLKKASKAL
ncbi:MAG TPA: hypothetical protein VLV48_01285, partial [Thermoanaerobaculia bacterium]|nr:hypothetical protein [Thermoanaerobaculia bacterium]